MKVLKTYKNIIVALLLPLFGLAQTVNIGEFVVTTGTVMSTVSDFNNTATASFINDGDVYVYNHFNNEGSVDHNNNGLTRFVGTTPQNITGTTISYLYNVQFNNNTTNQPAFGLSGELSIANESDFENGIVNNDDFEGSFTFEQNATHNFTAWDNSHVDGQVLKIGDNSFSYPIGDGGFYRYAEISAPDANEDIFTGKYFFENPDTNYPLANKRGVIELINNQEYWTITKDGGNSNIVLTLSWEEGTTPQFIVASPQTAIHIVRWDETQQLWLDEGGVVDSENKTVSTPLQLEDYGVFTLARVKEELILPGDVVVYNGLSPNGDGINDYFLIDNIQNFANNKVEIFNRWGIEVFSTTNYDSNGNVFRGISTGRMNVGGDLLPSGTYFYILSYDYTDNGSTTQRIKQVGYLYLNL